MINDSSRNEFRDFFHKALDYADVYFSPSFVSMWSAAEEGHLRPLGSLAEPEGSVPGLRDPEIWVEADPNRLRALDMTLADVANGIARASQDAPSGRDSEIRTGSAGSAGSTISSAVQAGSIESAARFVPTRES